MIDVEALRQSHEQMQSQLDGLYRLASICNRGMGISALVALAGVWAEAPWLTAIGFGASAVCNGFGALAMHCGRRVLAAQLQQLDALDQVVRKKLDRNPRLEN